MEKVQKKKQVEAAREQQAEDRLKSKLQKERAKAEMKRHKAELKEEEKMREQAEKEGKKSHDAKSGGAEPTERVNRHHSTPLSQRREVLRVLVRTRRQFQRRWRFRLRSLPSGQADN
mmetsp:Transcript_18925/g.38567  ORF Transcript_18925/g.38567 Transcript_18925/m.38567 type:complete len:117 (-) Transcript_18925:229-579(-)